MSSARSLEERVAALEVEVGKLREMVPTERKKGWQTWVGAFLNDPLYEKAMKLGRQYRESLRPKPRRKKKSRGDT